ncbi:MAG: G/U mismatch-specific DNA glycosylase [Deltaproteobacteria bacterium]|nr:MAG: G/U mismatch-specific DNA glycosylase [Deltaproteobacteria bacterium]
MTGPAPWRPTPQQLAEAYGATVLDIVRPRLKVLFCGINPSLYSGAVGHHFARPGNRFWKTLHRAGFTRRQLSPFEERELLQSGLGITNLVSRATAGAAELSERELRAGARRVRRIVRRFRPAVVAFLGVGAFRAAFGRPRATVGPQPERICGARVWVLPNPSGLNAHYQLAELAAEFGKLKQAVSSRAGSSARR